MNNVCERRFRNKECGQGLTEYAIVLSLVAVAAIAVMTLFGGAVRGKVISLIGAVTGDATLVQGDNNGLSNVSRNSSREGRRQLEGMKIDSADDIGIGGNQ